MRLASQWERVLIRAWLTTVTLTVLAYGLWAVIGIWEMTRPYPHLGYLGW